MKLAFACFMVLCTSPMAAQHADTDSLLRGDTIREVHVRGYRPNSHLREAPMGTNIVELSLMDDMPRILGNADPLHYAQLLPGVQTNSEYDAGLHVQGCDNAHNSVGINGVPVFNVSHLLGFFSIFNATHFSTMTFAKSPAGAAFANRLGGEVDIATADTLRHSAGGDLSIGPISSQGTLHIPVGSRSLLTLSARQAYLNFLYGRWLKIETEQMRYSFGDYNATWLYKPDSRHTLKVDFYHGGDRAGYSDDDYLLDTRLKWGNTMGALHYDSELADSLLLRQTLYVTNSYNDLSVGMSTLSVGVPSDITEAGYKASLSHRQLNLGLQVASRHLRPQDPSVEGMFDISYTPQGRQHTFEASLYGDYTLRRGRWAATAGLRSTYYHYGTYSRAAFDPVAALTVQTGRNSTLTLRGSVKHQYMHRTGFSDLGLPIEFWFAADGQFPAQYSWNTSLGFETWLLDRMFHVTAEVYYKRLYHQQECNGNIFDIIYSTYDLQAMLLHGRGYNTGFNILVEKRKGRLTGWMSYSFGRALRRFTDRALTGWYPANHERLHELNIVATYQAGRRWSFGGTFVVASGTPYTAPKRFYLINESLITEFEGHNANRLKPYLRLDLSASYDFVRRKGRRSGINLSLYNATMNGNDIYFRLKIYKDRFAGKPFRFLVDMLPSVNYYYHF